MTRAFALFTALAATPALAHPGHGAADPHGHAELLIAVGVAAAIGLGLYLRGRRR